MYGLVGLVAAQMMKIVIELGGKRLLGQAADIRRDEGTVQEGDDQRGAVRAQQPPAGVMLAQAHEIIMIHAQIVHARAAKHCQGAAAGGAAAPMDDVRQRIGRRSLYARALRAVKHAEARLGAAPQAQRRRPAQRAPARMTR